MTPLSFAIMQSQFDQAEEQSLVASFGPTEQRECRFELDETGYAYWWLITALIRRAEVVMVVQRPDGGPFRAIIHDLLAEILSQ